MIQLKMKVWHLNKHKQEQTEGAGEGEGDGGRKMGKWLIREGKNVKKVQKD